MTDISASATRVGSQIVLPEGATAILIHPETRVIAGYKKDGASFIGPFFTLQESVRIPWVRVGLETVHP